MCLIVYKPHESAVFSNNKFKTAAHSNPDGLGIMYVEDGRVQVHKLVGTVKEQLELYRELRENLDTFALHVRLATHGLENTENCHPYKVLSIDDGDAVDLYMMHNGIISTSEYDKTKSDTWHFVEYYLKPILKANLDLLQDKHIQELISDYIGDSKLLFMDSTGEVTIINEKLGTEVDGCWLSNTYSLAKNNYARKYSNYGWDDDAYWEDMGYESDLANLPSPYVSASNTLSDAEAKKALTSTLSAKHPDGLSDAEVNKIAKEVCNKVNEKVVTLVDAREQIKLLKNMTKRDIQEFIFEDIENAAEVLYEASR